MAVLGVDETPQFVQLALQNGEVMPEREHHKPSVTGSAMEPVASSIFVNLDDADRAAKGIDFG